ncbi:MAG: tetratricopeptide repeat protein, partial [Gemmatimonadetes bacterium]|nr:tetratricopeptide repeat protein [Gemmatimonadota bacterium]
MSRYTICVALLAWSCAPDTTEVDRLVERGRVLYLNGEYDAAIDSLNRAVALDDSRVLACLYLSRANLRLNRHDEAGRAIARALELDPDRPSLYEILGNIHVSRYTAYAYTETGEADLKAAVAAFRKAIAMDGGSSQAHYNLGVVYGFLDSTRLAGESFAAALDADSTLGAAHKKLGIIHRTSGRLQPSAASLEKATSLTPDDAEAHYQLGLVRRDAGEFEKAAASLEKAAGLDPISPKIGFSLGNVYNRLGRFEEGSRVLAAAERRRERLGRQYSEATPPRGGALSIGSPNDR